eukprot:maker-scaffold15_size728074-snap-gene-3.17 protein:Tk08854 transcript:maker-scaffold15_size728074-snap-gene-3.17-mRNA-1 annotation:"ribosomal protein s6"
MNPTRKGSLGPEWVREFQVGSPQRYQSHTLYEVTSRLYPVGFPEAATHITTQKRFSEFQKLHLALQQIHRGLYLKGQFPHLPQAHYFKRFEDSVIAERQVHALELLNFAALHPPLYNSQVFVNFFIMDDSDGDSQSSSEYSRNVSPFREARLPSEPSNVLAQLKKSGNIMDAVGVSASIGQDQTPILVPNPVNPPPTQPVTPTTPEEEMKNLPDYLSEAAMDVSQAVHYEIEENFDESIASYRNAIGTLLSSVQQDRCLKRQASVKRRIAQYINKAEGLVERRNRKCDSGSPSANLVKSPSKIPHLKLFGDIQDLKRYRIVDIISNKVLLAQDFQSEAQVVIKALQKSSWVVKTCKKSLLPTNIPNMVALKCYYETDDAIFLILDYLRFGQIYDVIRHIFIKATHESAPEDLESEPDMSRNPSISVIKPSKSFISNQRLLDDDGAEDEEAEPEEDLEFIHSKDPETLLCVGSEGIEEIDCSETSPDGPGEKNQNFDFMIDFADEEGEDPLESPRKIMEDSQCLLASIDARLEAGKSVAERVLTRLDKLETTIHSHLEGRTFTPNSPFRSRRGRIRPISRNSGDLDSSDSEPLMSPESPCRGLPLFSTYNFRGPLPLHILRQWGSQLCQVLMSLHSRGILVKDLNPRNLLLSDNGDLKLAYQCEWGSIDRSIDLMAQQCWYTAPEVHDIQPLSPACDWWSVGVILFEMTSGKYFVESYPCGLRLQPPVEFPAHIDSKLVDLISGFLQHDPSMRLGAGSKGSEDIQRHAFFKEIDYAPDLKAVVTLANLFNPYQGREDEAVMGDIRELDETGSGSIPARELRVMFNECDVYRTGQVRAQDLFMTIQSFTVEASGPIDKWVLEDLRLGLDPLRDNSFIDCASFIAITQDWVRKIRQGDQPNGGSRLHQSSFGLLSGSELESSSLEPPGRLTYEPDPNVTELSSEIQILKHALQRLSDEKTSLQRQFSTSDDLCGQLQADNRGLKARLEATLASLEAATKFQKELDAQRVVSQAADEERCSDLKTQSQVIEQQIRDLIEENCHLQLDLAAQHEIVGTVRENAQDAMSVADQLRHEAGILQETSEQKSQELEKLRSILLSCERKVMNTMEENEIKTAEIESLKGHIANLDEEVHRLTMEVGVNVPESPEMDANEVFQTEVMDDGTWNDLAHGSKGPKFFSTPFVSRPTRIRHSIGDEIKEVGIRGKSPLCDKAQDSVEEDKPPPNLTDNSCQTEPTAKEPWFDWEDLGLRVFVVAILLVTLSLFGRIKTQTQEYYPMLWTSYFPEPFPVLEISRPMITNW